MSYDAEKPLLSCCELDTRFLMTCTTYHVTAICLEILFLFLHSITTAIISTKRVKALFYYRIVWTL